MSRYNKPRYNPRGLRSGGGAVGPTFFFEDNFIDTEGVTLDNHTPDIDLSTLGWLNQANLFSCQSNQLGKTGSGTRRVYIQAVGQADYTVKIDNYLITAGVQIFLRIREDSLV